MHFCTKVIHSLVSKSVKYNLQNTDFILEVGINNITHNSVKYSLTLTSKLTSKGVTRVYMIQEQDDMELDIHISVTIHHIEHAFDEQTSN